MEALGREKPAGFLTDSKARPRRQRSCLPEPGGVSAFSQTFSTLVMLIFVIARLLSKLKRQRSYLQVIGIFPRYCSGVLSGRYADSYHIGYTMRFPRAMRIRDDLSIADCMSASGVLHIFLAANSLIIK